MELNIKKKKSHVRLKRYESGSEEYSPPTIKDHFQRQYFEILDCTINCIKSRFDQPGYNQYSKVESLLLKTMNGDKFEEEYDFVMMMLATFFSKYSYKHWQLKYLEKNPSLINLLQYILHHDPSCCMCIKREQIVFVWRKLLQLLLTMNIENLFLENFEWQKY